METIRVYVETMFKGMTKNGELSSLKEEILCNMEERYQELKGQGKSENEAVGTVISEFGNIDELLSEMGYTQNNRNSSDEIQKPTAKKEDVLAFIKEAKNLGNKVGIGVGIILCSVAVLILGRGIAEFVGLPEGVELMFVCMLLVGVCVAVGLFVYYGMRMDKYQDIAEGRVSIDHMTKTILQTGYDNNRDKFRGQIVIGVVLCCASVIPVIAGNMIEEKLGGTMGATVMLVLIAIAVYLFISAGVENTAYETALKGRKQEDTMEYWEGYGREKDYSKPESKEAIKWNGRIHAIMWPLVTGSYLMLGFFGGLWHPGWIVFPIAGILSPIIAVVVNIMTENRR